MKFVQNNSGSSGIISMFVFGLMVCGFFIVAFGAILNQLQITNNALISDSSMQYSQNRYDAINLQFLYWWALPIYVVILFVVWAIKNALEKQAGEI